MIARSQSIAVHQKTFKKKDSIMIFSHGTLYFICIYVAYSWDSMTKRCVWEHQQWSHVINSGSEHSEKKTRTIIVRTSILPPRWSLKRLGRAARNVVLTGIIIINFYWDIWIWTLIYHLWSWTRFRCSHFAVYTCLPYWYTWWSNVSSGRNHQALIESTYACARQSLQSIRMNI